MVLRYGSDDVTRHPQGIRCLHKIEANHLDELYEEFEVQSPAQLAVYLEAGDSDTLNRFHVSALRVSQKGKEAHASAPDWAESLQSQIIVNDALAKGPFDSETMLVLSDEWTVTNKGTSWTLDRNTRHLLGGRVITTTSRYFAPANKVSYLGSFNGWRLHKDTRVALTEEAQQLIALSAFQEYCTRADLALRNHNDHDSTSNMSWATRIYLTANGVTVKTLEQPSRKYALSGKSTMQQFRSLAGLTKVEQLWSLSKFQFNTWASLSHLAQLLGTPTSTDEEKRWWWDSLPRLF